MDDVSEGSGGSGASAMFAAVPRLSPFADGVSGMSPTQRIAAAKMTAATFPMFRVLWRIAQSRSAGTRGDVDPISVKLS
jgi:hypothetical protein